MSNVLFVLRALEFYDPVGVLTLAALLKKAGHHVRTVAHFETDVLKVAAEFAPDLVAYSATTGSHRFYYSLNKQLAARFKFFSVLGGPHATFFPEDQPASGMDAFCRGEGEGALLELADCLDAGARPGQIRNLVVNGVQNPLRPLIDDLDSLPFCKREGYYRGTWLERHPIRSFMVSRGCAYDCPYCFNSQWNAMYTGLGKPLRRQSVERVLDEIELVRRSFPTQFVRFNDDVFAHGITGWLAEFAEKYPKRIGIPFECYMRCELVTEDMARLLKEAGCRSVRMGIECGDYGVRRRLLDRSATNEQTVEAFQVLRRHGISTVATTMLALPDTTNVIDEKSVRLNVRARPDFGDFYVFHPYPKTPLAVFCASKGCFDNRYDGFSAYFGSAFSPLNCFTPEEKKRQVLLASWGTVAVFLPGLADFIIALLSRIPSRFLAFVAYFLVKILTNKSRITPVQLTFRDALQQLIKAYRLEKERRLPFRNFQHPTSNEHPTSNFQGESHGLLFSPRRTTFASPS